MVLACRNLGEVREQIDRLDAKIASLIIERTSYVLQAAQFKENIDDVVVPSRIEEIIKNVRNYALEKGGNPDILERTYREMINAFIDYERLEWIKKKGKN
jgi:isochorismate pyruvate lyase